MKQNVEAIKEKILKKVPSIKEVFIAEPPSHYEAFLYKYTDLDTNKKYLGMHEGYLGDGYWNSSESAEFKKICSESTSNIRYEILEYGDVDEIKTREHDILTKVDAKNSDDWYNMNNGIVKKQSLRLDLVKSIVGKILAGEFDVVDDSGRWIKEDKVKIYNLPRLQVRVNQIISDTVRYVTERVEEAHGNTDLCTPILIYENRLKAKLYNGETDLLGDGNNTIEGVYKAPHAVEIQIAKIPYEVHKDLSNLELRAIGGLLNKRDVFIKEPLTLEDGVKYIMNVYLATGKPADCPENYEWLEEAGFTSNQIKKTIFPKGKEAIKQKNLELANKVLIDYSSDSPHYSKLEDKVESLRDSETHAVSVTSANIRMDRVMTKLRRSGKPNIKVVVHHPSITAADEWNTIKALHDEDVDFWIRDKKINGVNMGFEWVVMPHLIDNKLVN
jgi:hypothetical protein